MKQNIQIAIIGTGAVGGFYGGLLQKAGFDLHYLAHTDYEHIREHGLFIESVRGNFRLPEVAVYRIAERLPRCDLVIIALKTTDNHQLGSILPHVVKPDGIILTLQNGLGSEESIAAVADPEKIMSGLCFLCSNKVGPGHIRHLDYGLITLGDYRSDGLPAGITPRLNQVSGWLKSAGISVRTVEDLLLARWKKLVWNIPFNGLTVVLGALTDQLLQDPGIRKRCSTLMQETAAAAAACARPIPEEFLCKMMVDTEKMEPYAPSMKLDFDRGRPMEVESIYGCPLRAARAAGVAMPETERLYHQLLELNPERRRI